MLNVVFRSIVHLLHKEQLTITFLIFDFVLVASTFGRTLQSTKSRTEMSGYIVSDQQYPNRYWWQINSRILIQAPEGFNTITLEFLSYHLIESSTASLKLKNVTTSPSTAAAGDVIFQDGPNGILPLTNHEYQYFRKSSAPFELIFNKASGENTQFMLRYHGKGSIALILTMKLWVCLSIFCTHCTCI